MTRRNIRTQASFKDDADSALWREELATLLTPEDWHEIGTDGQPAYQNGWSTFTGAHFGYRLLGAIDSVQIHGKLTPGTETNGTAIFTLPEGYRPNYPSFAYHIATNIVGGAGGRIYIESSGGVRVINLDTSGTFYDVNIIFPLYI